MEPPPEDPLADAPEFLLAQADRRSREAIAEADRRSREALATQDLALRRELGLADIRSRRILTLVSAVATIAAAATAGGVAWMSARVREANDAMAAIRVVDGVVEGNDATTGWTLATGEGAREWRVHVDFPVSFPATPLVHVSLRSVDAQKDHNFRATVLSQATTPRGTDIVFRTWGDSQIHWVEASWLAYYQPGIRRR